MDATPYQQLALDAVERGVTSGGEFIVQLAFMHRRPNADAVAEIMTVFEEHRRTEELLSGTTMSLEEYQAKYMQQKPRVKGKQRIKGVSTDKAFLFANAWRDFAPASAPKLKPEYEFAPGKNYRADYRVGRHHILIEVEGATKRTNGGRHNTDQDRYKTNLAAALGWRVFRFSTEALADDPAGCVDLVLKAIKLARAS